MTVKIVSVPFVLGPQGIEDLLRCLLRKWKGRRIEKAVEVAMASNGVLVWRDEEGQMILEVDGQQISELTPENATGYLLQHFADEGFFKGDTVERTAETVAALLTGAAEDEDDVIWPGSEVDDSADEFGGDVLRLIVRLTTAPRQRLTFSQTVGELVAHLEGNGQRFAARTVKAVLQCRGIGAGYVIAAAVDKLAAIYGDGPADDRAGRSATAEALEAGRVAPGPDQPLNGHGPAHGKPKKVKHG